MTKEELNAKYGYGEFVRWDNGNRIYVSRHTLQEAAEAYRAANEEHWDYPGRVEQDGDSWLLFTDIGPALDRANREYTDGAN